MIRFKINREKSAWLLLRVGVGGALAMLGYAQWHDPDFALTLTSVLSACADRNPFFWYEDLLRYVLVPNAPVLASVLPVAEMGLGAMIALGVLTPWVFPAAFLLVANFWLAMQHWGWVYAGLSLMAMGVIGVLGLAQAGRVWGLDGWLLKLPWFTGNPRYSKPWKPNRALQQKKKRSRKSSAKEPVASSALSRFRDRSDDDDDD